jgi:hypothetical protein
MPDTSPGVEAVARSRRRVSFFIDPSNSGSEILDACGGRHCDRSRSSVSFAGPA